MHTGNHGQIDLPARSGQGSPQEAPEDFETRPLDPDDALVPDFEVFKAAKARFLARVAAPQSTAIETSDGPRR